MDLTESIAPRSDQLNSEDLLTGPRTFTIREVRQGASAEQPVDVELVEFPGRPWKPSKTSRRVLVSAWGSESDVYAGRRITLYRDPTIRFGKDEVGGIRVSHMSHLAKPLKLALTVTRGKKAPYVVEPLPDEAPRKVNPNGALLAEIAEAALAIGMSKQQVADRWADSHDGQSIREATDTAALKALRDELRDQAAPPAEDPPAEPLWPATPPIPA